VGNVAQRILLVLALVLLGAPAAEAAVPRPTIVSKPIPFGAKRKQEMAAYAKRHYGLSTYRLKDPRVIVEHYTVTSSFQATWNTFAPDRADPELHELPGTCAHFVVDRDGTIYQLVPLGIMCRHTVGLNYTAIGIEHVGSSDAQILSNPRQMAASLRLTRWLRCRYGIGAPNVIGHNESLSSPYHREDVARLRTQTHGDWTHADMTTYRRQLSARGNCG
jgi:beta-N-acetylhexosaminidase